MDFVLTEFPVIIKMLVLMIASRFLIEFVTYSTMQYINSQRATDFGPPMWRLAVYARLFIHATSVMIHTEYFIFGLAYFWISYVVHEMRLRREITYRAETWTMIGFMCFILVFVTILHYAQQVLGLTPPSWTF